MPSASECKFAAWPEVKEINSLDQMWPHFDPCIVHSPQELKQTSKKPHFSETNLGGAWWQTPNSKCHLARVSHSLSYYLGHISPYKGKRKHPNPQDKQGQGISARTNHSALLPSSMSASKRPLKNLSMKRFLKILFP